MLKSFSLPHFFKPTYEGKRSHHSVVQKESGAIALDKHMLKVIKSPLLEEMI